MPTPTRRLWALVMNATEMRIVRSLGSQADPDAPKDEIALRIEPQKLSDIMADKPGRSHASVGDGPRSAMEYASDPVLDATRGLLRDAIVELEKHRAKGAFRELAVFADPKVLGEWRKLCPEALASLVIREDATNLVQLKPHDLRVRLENELGPPV
jgi:protein required for attachment to host cells